MSKDWIQNALNPANKGKFKKKARRAHMSTLGYAAKVLKKGSHASKKTKQEARFAENVGRLRK